MYHERFNNLHPRTVEAVDEIAPAIWNQDEDEALQTFRALAARLADVYDMPAPDVEFGSRNVYYLRDGRIEIENVSVVSFLHEFRHHMQQHGRQANDDEEEDARGWSISLFAEAEPEYFDSAWEDGRILFMPPYDPGWQDT